MGPEFPDTWRRLLRFLKDSDHHRRTFSIDNVVAATGLKPASVKAYFSKKLCGLYVVRLGGGQFRASGIAAVDESEFEAVMTQNSLIMFKDFDEWKEQFEDLVNLGRKRGYRVETALADVLNAIKTGKRS
jgi:hypothetical protein